MQTWIAAARRRYGRLALAALAVLAGCGGPMTSPTYRSPEARTFAQSAMAQGPMLVVIQGEPFAHDQERTRDAVLAAMARAMSWTGTPQFTTDAAEAPTASLYVVMTFNTGAIDGNVQCTVPPAGGGPEEDGGVAVSASFCGSRELISNTYGRISTADGADDPAFARLISQVTTDLFPPPGWLQPGFGVGIGVGSGGWSGGGGGIGIGF